MANNLHSPTGEQARNRREELARALEREIEKNRRSRTEEGNAAGSSCTSPSMKLPTPLLKLLVECCSSMTSQRSKGSFPPPGSSRGLSPSQSVSSDSSVCGGLNSKDVEGSNPAKVGLPKTAPARPNYGRGIAARGIQPGVIGQKGVGPTPNSPMQSSAPNAQLGRSGESTTIAREIGCGPKLIECAPAKVPKKRKRKSKKPLTTIIETTSEEFSGTVQKLTGFREPTAPVVRPQPEPRPQPERPQSNAVPIDVDLDSQNPPPRPDSSLTSMMSPVRSSSPTASDRAPEATFSIHNSATSISSSSKSSGLNYCMGYEQAIPFFLEEQQQDYDENLGQLQDDSPAPDSVYRHTSKPMEYKKQEVSTTPTSSVGVSVQDAASQRSESKRKEDIPREHGCSGSSHDLVSGAPISHPFTTLSPAFALSHRPGEPNGLEIELESDQEWIINGGFILADSFLNYQ